MSLFKLVAAALFLLPTIQQVSESFDPTKLVSGVEPPKRLALFVGISNYSLGTSPKDGWSSLSTSADINNIQRTLRERFQFEDTETLSEGQATQSGIISAFRKHLVARVAPGDSIVFYFTGHGHQIIDEAGGDVEPDGLDEAIVTWLTKEDQALPDDLRRNALYLRDDVLNMLLKELASKMLGSDGKLKGSITVILDSCNSGSGTKGAAIPKGRPWNDAFDGPAPKGANTGEGGGWDAQTAMPAGIVVISGSESGQFSYMMDRAEDGSAFTYYLCQRLADVSSRNLGGVSYKDLFEWVRVRVFGIRPNQNPQLEGATSSLLFGDGTLKGAEGYVRVSTVSSDSPYIATLEQGSISGISVDSKFELFAAGSDVSQASNKIAKLTIESVEPFSATGKVEAIEGQQLKRSSLLAARAVLSQFSTVVEPLRVLAPKERAEFAVIRNLPFVVTDGVKDTDFDVKFESVKGPGQYQRKTGAFVKLVDNRPETLASRMLAEWRWKELVKLSAPSGAPKVGIDLLFVDSGTNLEPGQVVPAERSRPGRRTAGGTYVMEPGDEAVLVGINLTSKNLFLTLVYLDLDGNVHVFPANALAQQSVPPDGKPRVIVGLQNVQEPWGTEIFKLIGTEQQVDLSGLSTPAATRAAPKGEHSVLQDLLFGLLDGNTKGPKVSVGRGHVTWGVADLALTSRPRRIVR